MAIWGAGAVGIGLASALAGSEPSLRVIARDPVTRRALATRGIVRNGLLGDAHVAPERLRLLSAPDTLATDPPEWLLVCTKAFASTRVAEELEPISTALRSAGCRVILCQNGWGNEAPFLRNWPRERLLHARVITGFRRHEAHEVEITAHAAPIAMGSLFGDPIDGLERVVERLSKGGLPAETRDDMEAVLWAKMLYNCALNPLGALTRRRYGELAQSKATRAIMAGVVEEIFVVLDRSGHGVDWPNADAYLETFYRDLIPPTAKHESSMLQDLRAGKPTEIEALCGAVERLGADHGVPTPIVSALAALVRQAEGRRADL